MTPAKGLTRNMALLKFLPSSDAPSPMKHLSLPAETHQLANSEPNHNVEPDVEIDIREVYFLIMHFLSSGPCQRTYGQLWNELLEHQLLPRRYHAWYSRNGVHCGDENDDGLSFPLSYNKLVERYPHIKKDHLVKLLKQLVLCKTSPSNSTNSGRAPNAADVPTLLGTGSFSLLRYDRDEGINEPSHPLVYMRWPHMKADQVRGLSLRELGGGFSRHQRAPSIRAACYAIAKPSTMVQKMQNIKRLRGHRNAVYCAIFDRLGRYVVTGSDDRLVKIWSMETAYCLASCRGHEGDITDLAVSSNNAVVASSSNDFIIRVWRLPDGLPISVLRGHTGAVTAIAFSPRPGYQLLSSSDDGTCRIWDARNSFQHNPRIYVPRPLDSVTGRSSGPSSSTVSHNHQIFCCAFNANGTIFVTGSSDTLARVWNACKPNIDNPDQPNHEIDVLAGHENDVNYVQFSGCAVASRFISPDPSKEDSGHRFKNSWFTHDNIVTCSRDGSAIIWVPRSRRSHGKAGRWTRAYHLKVPPPPMPPQPIRGGPRQRILPTPRGVNMIIWSLDNRFVLAAIMDCRICVWNASDGSLVHSLTGHTESTYVLDVHPFNPRIAMSAGYDGKTIVWDIWEGTPIQIYDISRFKLVDGKFSSDGTSIILSDDVGQLYILSTGQGESKQDAKYDQFFLGDYRPLVQDSFGNVVDQETQLAPYRRNMQDLLCDSGMIPYPEPYQSIYQQRRLGSLGIEWRPSPLKFAVGPDFSLDPAYQMLPLADLDLLIEPLPEFVDAMDWEPENEVQSDTTDSEYNVPEDYSTGGEQGSLNSNSSIDPECSGEDTGGEDAQRDRLRRSKRKKHKAEMEFMSFSGRRIKRRNLDESDEHPIKSNRNRKLKVHLKTSKKKSASKSSRPQRAAARNARHFFSKLKGASIDVEDEDGSVSDSSESESVLQDSIIESGESDTSSQNITKHSKGKEVYLDDSEDAIQPFEPPKSHVNSVNRGRLILKLPIRNFNRPVPPEDIMLKCSTSTNGVGSSSKAPGEAEEANQSRTNLEEPNYSLGEADITVGVEDLQDKIEGHINHSIPDKNGSIKWGGFKIRSSKRLKLGETATSDVQAISSSRLDDRNDMERSNLHEYVGQENDSVNVMQDGENLNVKDFGLGAFGGISDPAINLETTTFVKPGDHDADRELDYLAIHNSTTSSTWNGTNSSPELSKSKMPVSTKIRLKANIDREASPKHEKKSLVASMSNGKHAVLPGSPQYPVFAPDDSIDGCNLDNRSDGSREYDMLADKSLHSNPNKMYSAVYRRLKSHKSRTSLEVDESGSGDFSLYLCNNNSYNGIEGNEGTVDWARRTRSTRSKALINDSNNLSGNLKYEEDIELEPTSRNLENTSTSRCQFKYEEWGSKSSITVGLRSARNRRANYARDTSPADRKKSHLLTRKGSWLMMSVHEGGSRYIPQLGDEVVYLRQGHQEYIEYCRAREVGPWISMKGRTIGAVEYCKVVELEYSTVSGSGASCCKMTLEFVDPDSSVLSGSFKLSLPEETSFPDFLVERSRFEASLQRNWRFRDKCKVWWRNEGEEDGGWWDGRITAVEAKSSEFPESPWERYRVRYKSEPADTHLHSPWELFDDDTHWEQPRVDHESKAKLLSALDKLELGSIGQDRYGVHELRRVSQRPQFRNRFPVPLTLEVIHLRLESDYYRSVEALKHDFEVMLSNFEAYAAKNENLLKRLKRLSEWFNKTLSSS